MGTTSLLLFFLWAMLLYNSVQEAQLRKQDILLYEEQNHEAKIQITQMTKIQLMNFAQEKDEKKQLFVSFKTLNGQVQAFIAPQNGYELSPQNREKSDSKEQTEEGSQKVENGEEFDSSQRRINQKWKNSLLQIQDGLNIIDLQKLQTTFTDLKSNAQQQHQSVTRFVLVILPILEDSEIMIKLGQPRHGIQLLNIGRNMSVQLQGHTIHGKVYKIQAEEDFGVRFMREEGFPSIKIISCSNKNQNQCIYSPQIVPHLEKQKRTQKSQTIFSIQRMMTQEQQFQTKVCKDCHYYVLIQSYEEPINLNILVKQMNTVIELKQNQIKQQYIQAGMTKQYAIWIKYNEKGFGSIKVYQGQIVAKIYDKVSDYKYEPTEHSGIIPIQIPIADENQFDGMREVQLLVTAIDKDATVSLLYSSGQYEVYLKDGETISQEIQSNQIISFYYLNEQIQKQAMYLSFSVDDPIALKKLKMHIFYHQNIQGLLVRSQYVPGQPLHDMQDAKSMVFQIPGNYPKLSFTFENVWDKAISMDMTINDEEIILLPLYHSLALQIEKDDRVNLLVKNNEQGFVELAIKKCDDSNPTLGYSLDSVDFLNEIYDYESVGQSQRITRNSIKVKRGKGLYVRISGDGISNSFIEISARYLQLDRKKFEVNRLQKGDHGNIKYQLLTDSKAEITFTGLECGDQCRDSTVYQCVWSTTRADLYRQLICPNSFVVSSVKSITQTGSYIINIKPAHSDNQVSFKHLMSDNILYMNIKASHVPSKTQFYYKDIEIVTIEGQLSRLSNTFKQKIVLISVCLLVGLYLWMNRTSKRGYKRIKGGIKAKHEVSISQVHD